MIQLKTKINEIKDSNLVYLLEKKSDISKLDFLKLDKKIVSKMEKTIKEAKNIKLDFFLWNKDFENLIIFYFNKSEKQDINYFMWPEFKKLSYNLTLLPNNSQNINVLLNNCLLWRYKFEEYKSESKKDKIYMITDADDKKIAKDRILTIENIILSRNLWFMPANDLYPESFAKIIKKEKFKNTKVKIFDSKKVEKLGLGLLHNVWKGSSKKPYMVILERIVNKKFPTIWLVWKWVTYDTWWIQVKPWNYMYEMKWDMCWAATTFSIMKELDKKDLNVNIIACIVLAENHINWDAYKPSDILKSYSWKTVDIIHTDAEWRLVLADGISYISDKYKLDTIMSVATLTWACMVGLGFRYAWIMWTDNKIINKFLDYSDKNIEKYNRLPFDDYFIEKTKSEVADLENLNTWIYAGSTMWAAFLSNFLLNNEKYVHLDIAWTALNSYEAYAYVNKDMTGFWVDSISSILLDLNKQSDF